MDDISDTVFRAPGEGADQYVYVTDGRDDPVTLWSYTVEQGFLAVEERPRSHLDDWERVEELPEEILEQVSGDRTPGEE
ncbi:MAG: hypothetical protein ABEJ68_02660 [Halobacteriaceae archaeon]